MDGLFVLAHGLVGRSDLPIPEWLFGWAAAIVLIVSFVALAVLWPTPRLEDGGFRPLPAALGRVLTSRAVEILCGAIGVFLLGLTIYAGFAGVQAATTNWAPTFIYVIVWVGLVPVSVLFGDVFRAFNPWRAIGLAAFAWMELVYSDGDSPEQLAIAASVYTVLTCIGMALYGVDRWIDRGEAFSVYFGLFARISPFERRDRQIGLRRPLSGLGKLDPIPGTVPVLAVMIGGVTFDGAAEGDLWGSIAPELTDFFGSLGLEPARAIEAAFTVGLIAAILVVGGFYRLGMTGAKGVGGGFTTTDLARRFVHTLVPIAAAYVLAHYWTLLLYQGQAIGYLAVDPLGNDPNLERTIDYGVIGATAAWYWQVGFVVGGHCLALASAHDRALALYRQAKLAVRSQYWMLVIMIGFTSLALWLLSQANA